MLTGIAGEERARELAATIHAALYGLLDRLSTQTQTRADLRHDRGVSVVGHG
ncbi:hypothetical protein ACGFX2_33080 [Streptomyces goshikiensis]|uniref:hypothetical protein n=1 Tax=Streptomyces goshikiensis TaxID=1942 RepID=UPI0037167357